MLPAPGRTPTRPTTCSPLAALMDVVPKPWRAPELAWRAFKALLERQPAECVAANGRLIREALCRRIEWERDPLSRRVFGPP